MIDALDVVVSQQVHVAQVLVGILYQAVVLLLDCSADRAYIPLQLLLCLWHLLAFQHCSNLILDVSILLLSLLALFKKHLFSKVKLANLRRHDLFEIK